MEFWQGVVAKTGLAITFQECMQGMLRVELESTVQSIDAAAVTLVNKTGPATLRNDAVIVCAGGLLPTRLLQSVGIAFDTKHGTA